jgi:hypothetical protein
MFNTIRQLAFAAVAAISITTPVLANFELLDNGTGTKQIVHDGGAVYSLKDNGNIWRFSGGRWERIDDGEGTRAIAAAQGRVYAAKNDGRVFRLTYGKWSALGMRGTKQITAAGKDLYTLEANDDVYMFYHGDGQWRKLDNGTNTRQIVADERAGLFVLKTTGLIFRHIGNARFEQFDDGQQTKQIDVSNGVVFVLKDNGNVWRNNGQWARIDDGVQTHSLAADGNNCTILKDNGNVYSFRNEQWHQAFMNGGIRQVAARADEVVLLHQTGNILIARNGSFASSIRVNNFDALYGK